MLNYILVNNVALIEEARIDFEAGLNILSGETGAGKSIIIDSINFVLGRRVDKDFIRAGADSAMVEAHLTINDKQTIAQIAKHGIDIKDDGELLIYRSHNARGRSVVKVNGAAIALTAFREISPLLVDIHGQHEHQSLLDPSRHMHLLDRFCGAALDDKKAELAHVIVNYRALLRDIAELKKSGLSPEALDMYHFQKNEIESANLAPDDEERLSERRKTLNNSQKLAAYADELKDLLNGDGRAQDLVYRGLALARSIAAVDNSKEGLADSLMDAYSRLTDIADIAAEYADGLSHDPAELEQIEEKLDLIFRLKQKYKGDVKHILRHHQQISQKIDDINNSQEVMDGYNAKKKAMDKEIGLICIDLSKMRRKAAAELSKQIEGILHELGMEKARFEIDISRRNDFSANGFDKVEFMISANLGNELAPLSKIASGGEMSRVMLALKTALANFDNIESFIFDEIDTGISGRTAQQVAEKLAIITEKHQVLCITHLPQIAAMGDINFLIEKQTVNDKTYTNIHKLDGDKVIEELARLIGGVTITDTTLSAAKEMKLLAGKYQSVARGGV